MTNLRFTRSFKAFFGGFLRNNGNSIIITATQRCPITYPLLIQAYQVRLQEYSVLKPLLFLVLLLMFPLVTRGDCVLHSAGYTTCGHGCFQVRTGMLYYVVVVYAKGLGVIVWVIVMGNVE